MNKPSYVCSKCSKDFRRRWNAQRHNDTVHKGLSNINIKYKSRDNVNALKNNPGRYTPFFAAASKFCKYGQTRQNNAKDSPFTPFKIGSHLKKPNESAPTIDEGEREEFVNITTEKIAIQVEKLEKLFSGKMYPHAPAENTTKRICNIVAAALAMPDPIRYAQDMFTYYNRQYHSAKMIFYVAASYGIDTFEATVHLKNVLMEKYL